MTAAVGRYCARVQQPDIVPLTTDTDRQEGQHGMIRTTPFHERTSALNETGLWSHWSGTLAADRYQMSDKFEYFAVRNAAGVFDSSPALQVPDRRHGRRGVPGRDPRPRHPDLRARPRPVHALAATTAASSSRTASSCATAPDEYLLTSAEPNLACFADRIGRDGASRSRRSATDIGTLALQGPRSRDLLARLVPADATHPVLRAGARARSAGAAVTVSSRTGYSGDLGYEIWIRPPDALHVWDTLWDIDRGPRRPAVRARRAVHAPHRGRPAAPRRRLRLEPLRLERRAPLDADRARLGVDVQGPRRRRPRVHRPQRPRARDRRQDLALGDDAASSSTGGTTTGSTTRPG